MTTLELNLSEDNEIGFKLKIEGSDKDLGSSKPNIRFVLSEQDTGKGWIFSTDKTDEGVSVTIPSMKGIISEDKKYQGKLEVILAGRYFTPTEIEVQFNEPLKVEAAVAVVTKKNNTESKLLEEVKDNKVSEKEQELSIESEIDSIIIKDKEIKNTKQNTIPFKSINEEKDLVQANTKPTKYSDLSEKQKEEINVIFVDKCKKYNINSKEVKKLMKEGTSYTKKRLTALFAQATKEYIENL